jgi:hypothetical protein
MILKELFLENAAKWRCFSRPLRRRFTDSKGVIWRIFGEKHRIFFISFFAVLRREFFSQYNGLICRSACSLWALFEARLQIKAVSLAESSDEV